jgi:hypothetical protein
LIISLSHRNFRAILSAHDLLSNYVCSKVFGSKWLPTRWVELSLSTDLLFLLFFLSELLKYLLFNLPF